MVTVASLLALGTAWALLFADVEPIPTWFYVFAWYPTLVLLDDRARRRDGQASLFAPPLRFLTMAAWSVLIWLVFEAANFQLQNWYYVFLPDRAWERWLGITVSFATVVPAVVAAERWLRAHDVGSRWRGRPFPPSPHLSTGSLGLGIGMAAAALAFPRHFFPLIWGAGWLMAEPALLRRAPEWSLLRDVECGDWRRIGRIAVGGLLIGLVWEFYNAFARGQWIYTVPWLEHTKLFEMPPLGFLGFPFFALEAWSMYHVLFSFGLAPAADGSWRPGRWYVRLASGLVGAAAGVVVLLGMESKTHSSTTPRLEQLSGVTAATVQAVRAAGYSSLFALAETDRPTLIDRTGLPVEPSRSVLQAARLATLRGIGTEHAATLRRLGFGSVCELARASPGPLWTAIAAATRDTQRGRRPIPAEVRVWVGAARRACPTAARSLRDQELGTP